MSDPKYVNIGEPEDKVIEEMGELLQEISKARRFGYFNYHPNEPDKLNIDRIKSEMADCVEAFEMYEKKLRLICRGC
jgi:NTP pyrophosphatase (non-canonical NTP hydrolase)